MGRFFPPEDPAPNMPLSQSQVQRLPNRTTSALGYTRFRFPLKGKASWKLSMDYDADSDILTLTVPARVPVDIKAPPSKNSYPSETPVLPLVDHAGHREWVHRSWEQRKGYVPDDLEISPAKPPQYTQPAGKPDSQPAHMPTVHAIPGLDPSLLTGGGGGAPKVNIPTHVFDEDTRQLLTNNSFPWSAVGRIKSPRGVCTGTLVGHRLVLTASHCVPWTQSGTADWIRFSPGYMDGTDPYGSSYVENVVVFLKLHGKMTNLQSAFDQAVLVLKEPLGDSTGYLGYTTFQRDWIGKDFWYNVGYPREPFRAQQPVWSDHGTIEVVDDYRISKWTAYLMGTFMDVTGGHSGGPLWGWFAGEETPRVVAVISSESTKKKRNKSGDNNLSGGPALTQLINYARERYDTGKGLSAEQSTTPASLNDMNEEGAFLSSPAASGDPQEMMPRYQDEV